MVQSGQKSWGNMVKYIWQNPTWPKFSWNSNEIISLLSKAKKAQGLIIGQTQFLNLDDQADIIVEETFATSAIEGESLDRNSIRSSVAKRLGLPTAGLPEVKQNSDGVVEILMDATINHIGPLNELRLFGWQAALFPTGFSGIHKINVGKWRLGKNPMEVVSGPMGREKVHYVAPPSSQVSKDMTKFLNWWNSPPKDLDGLLRAAIAHFWFVSIHPFEDGNGRIARVITDMALAQDEKTSIRLYSLSTQIMKEKKIYYNILESTQKGKGDITEWLKWFLEMFLRSLENSKNLIEKSIFIGNFYSHFSETALNERQKKVIKKLLEHFPEGFKGGLTNQKYSSITKISSETAKRDIKDLVKKGILSRNEGGGRSISYRLKTLF